ncbi:MAG: AI-2E family transporter [Clostridia bacterium]|nr:AI-2E family transporter [Clostridia bacterium]
MGINTKKALLVTITGVVLFAALMNFSAVTSYTSKLITLILPVIVGGIIALFLIVPMNGIQKILKRMFSKAKRKPSEKAFVIVSFLLTLACIALVLTLVLTLLIPEITSSVKVLYTQIEARIKELSLKHFDVQWIQDLVSKINFKAILDNFSEIVNKLTTGADFIFVNVISVFSSTINIVTTALFAIIISIYAALEKRTVARHGKLLIGAYLKPSWAKGILKFCRSFEDIFSKFLFGQCSEALILGVLIFISFSIFKMPYASLVAVLTAVCAIIPYIGAFISCAVSVFLTLLVAPEKALLCLIIYLAVQFVETQLIYPRVVGTAVGLSPLYTLVAALIGGNLLGIIGIIFFIPLFAVILELFKEHATKKIEKKVADGKLPACDFADLQDDEEETPPAPKKESPPKTPKEKKPPKAKKEKPKKPIEPKE